MSNVEKTVMFALPNLMTGQLACVAGTTAGRSWDLSAGTFTIGRLDEHDLVLKEEPGVSKTHAKIIGQGDRYVLVDAESRNGTLLNGELVHRGDLYDGDEIRICGCVLRFTQKGGPARPRRTLPQPSMAPTPSEGPATMTLQQPAPASMSMVPVVVAPPAPSATALIAWYAGGLFLTLLLGGGVLGALVALRPEAPAEPVVAAVVPSPPATVNTLPVAPVAPAVDPGADVATGADQGAAAGANTAPDTGADVATEGAPPPAAAADETPPAGAAAAGAGDAVALNLDAVDGADDGAVDGADDGAAGGPDDAAADEGADDGDDGAAIASTSRTARRRASAPAGGVYTARVDTGRSEVLRSRTGGRVRSVEVKDGAQVPRGTIIVTFESGVDPAELATLQDRVASLENVEGEEARRDLRAARAKLAALEAAEKASPIVAGMDGQLTGFNVSPGQVLKPNESVGTIVDGDVTPRVRITVGRGVRVKTGQTVTLMLSSGASTEGTVVSVSGRSVLIDVGSEDAGNVSGVRLP